MTAEQIRHADYLAAREAWMLREIRAAHLRREGYRRDVALALGPSRPSLRVWLAAIRSYYLAAHDDR